MPKILYIASTAGHLRSFHLPYLRRLSQEGWTVHAAGQGANGPIPGAQESIDICFEKRMFSPRNLAAVRQLVQLLRRERYDAVSVHTSLAAFFTRLAVILSGRRRETAVINTVHGYLFDQDTPFLKRTILLWAEKLTARATDLLLTMNRRDTEIANRYRLSAGPVREVPGMGVDFARFVPADAGQRAQARQRFGIPREAFVLAYAAEFSARKNQQDLIRALPQLPEQVWLLLAGRGDKLEECRALCTQLNVADRVVFAGFVPDVETCYAAADVCVSASRSEGLPFNLMEAMHCALPVLATAVKGHEDLIVPGQTGLLFPFGDRAQLCEQVETLLSRPALCLELGYHGMDAVERFRLEQVLEENMAVLNAFFASRGLRPEAPAAAVR